MERPTRKRKQVDYTEKIPETFDGNDEEDDFMPKPKKSSSKPAKSETERRKKGAQSEAPDAYKMHEAEEGTREYVPDSDGDDDDLAGQVQNSKASKRNERQRLSLMERKEQADIEQAIQLSRMQMTVDLTYTSPGKMHETIPSTSQLTPARSDIVSRGASEGTPGNRATTNAMTFDHEDHQPSISSNSGIVPDSAATPNSKLNTNSHDSTATGSAMANKVEKPTKKMQSKMVCDDSDDSLEELSENLDWDDDSDDDDFGGRKKPKKPKAQPKAKAKQSSSTMSSAKKKGTKNSKSAATSIESALADISCASNIPNQGTGRVSGATPLKIGDTSRNSGDDSVTTPLAETKAASHAKTAMKPTSVQQPVFAGFNSAPSRKRSTSHGPDTHNTNISSPKSSSPIRREQGMTAGSFPHLRVGLSRRGNVKPLHAYLKK